jgi:hypothetical protein
MFVSERFHARLLTRKMRGHAITDRVHPTSRLKHKNPRAGRHGRSAGTLREHAKGAHVGQDPRK